MAGRIVLLLACLFLMPQVHAELSDSKRALIQEIGRASCRERV